MGEELKALNMEILKADFVEAKRTIAYLKYENSKLKSKTAKLEKMLTEKIITIADKKNDAKVEVSVKKDCELSFATKKVRNLQEREIVDKILGRTFLPFDYEKRI